MKIVRGAVAGLFLSALAVAGARAQDAEVTLTVHHFLGPNSPAHTRFMQPWAERVEEQSGGRIAVEIFPAMAMGGAPPELYGQARDGLADIVWTLIGYTPGVFPRAEVFELPTIHKNSAKATTLAIQDTFDLIAEDFADVHPILIHTHAGQALHTIDDEVAALDDLKGQKLRIPSRTGALLIGAWGAQPVGMPVPELPQALSKGVVDGALIPFEVVPALKVQELTQYSITGPDDTRFGTSVFAYVMNKERYEDLPDDLKAVIDANSGIEIAGWIGGVFDESEIPGRDAVKEAGNEIIALTPEAMQAFDAKGREVVDGWVEEVTAEGIDGQALVDAARGAVEAHTE